MTSESSGFDPGGYFAFDLARGAVHTRHGERVLVLSADVLGPLVSTAARHGDLTAVRGLGKHIGDAAARSLGADTRRSTPEAVLTHLNGTLALLGWGTLTLERLGLAALLGGVLTSVGGQDVACVPIAGSAGGSRFVVVHPGVAETVWSWAKDGADLASIVGRLAQEAA